jgi:hypothetical protein
MSVTQLYPRYLGCDKLDEAHKKLRSELKLSRCNQETSEDF